MNISQLLKLNNLALFFPIFLGAASASAAPVVFNSTETAYPGDVIYLQGDNLMTSGSTTSVYFYVVTGTESSLSTPPATAQVLTPVTSSTNAVTVRIPANNPLGLFAVWVSPSAGSTTPPTYINRARAMSFEYQAVPASYPFRIFGRNLCLEGANPIITFSSSGYSGTCTISGTYPNDTNVLQVSAPSNLPTSGTYTVEVSNGYGHSSAGTYDVTPSEETILARTGGTSAADDPFGLGVPWGYDFINIYNTQLNVTGSNSLTHHNYGADPTGGTNSLTAFQTALSDAGNTAYYPNGATVYVPGGTYTINKGTAVTALTIPSQVVLMGSGTATTIINDESPAITGYSFLISLTTTFNDTMSGNLMGAQGITFNETVPPAAIGTYGGSIRNFSQGGYEIFFDHLDVNFAHAVFFWSGTTGTASMSYGSFIPQSGYCTNVLTQNCTMNYLTIGNDNYYNYGYTYGNFYTLRDNSFSDFFQRVNFIYMNNVVVDGNTFTRSGTFPPYNWGGSINCGGLQCFGTDVTVLDNVFNTDGTQLCYYGDGESTLAQSQPFLSSPSNTGTTSGTEASATGNTLTPTVTSGSNAYVTDVLAITSGSCAGEWGKITANNGATFTISPSWATIPPANSQYSIILQNSYLWSTVSTPSGSNTLTDTTQNWPVNFMTGTTDGYNAVAIINGPGIGQIHNIASNNSNTLTIDGTWVEPPAAGSTYAVTTTDASRWLVKGNSYLGVPRGVVFYCGSYDNVVADNTLVNTGWTIYLRGDQRPTLDGTTYDRFNPTWKDLVADNVLVHNPSGTYTYNHTYADANFSVTGSASLNGQGSIVGTESLGVEMRRNMQQSILIGGANPEDPESAEFEGYDNDVSWSSSLGTYVDVLPGKLGTLFDDNVSVNTVYPYRLTTGDYQTTIWDALPLYPASTSGTLIYTGTLNGATNGATNTGTGNAGYNCFFVANFSGSGVSTGLGGTGSNVVDEGAFASVYNFNETSTCEILSGSEFVTGTGGSGAYLNSLVRPGGGASCIEVEPFSPRYSWGRIFDSRNIIMSGSTYQSGIWLVNGGFDIFWRPDSSPIATITASRPIDILNEYTHGMRLIFCASGATGQCWENSILTGTGTVTITGTYLPGFVQGQIYHMGVTYTTNETTGVTTANIFAAPGTGAITTSSTANLIGSGTFMLDPAVTYDASGFLSGGTWNFCTAYASGTNDYDGFRMYYKDSGTFPALVTPDP